MEGFPLCWPRQGLRRAAYGLEVEDYVRLRQIRQGPDYGQEDVVEARTGQGAHLRAGQRAGQRGARLTGGGEESCRGGEKRPDRPLWWAEELQCEGLG